MSDRPKKGAERRLDERVPTQIRVRLKYPDVETFLERYATNISRGGIFIQTQRTKPPGTLIRFEFQLQDASPVIRGEGRVSWVVAYDAAHAERAYGMGVKFTRLDARSKSYIDRIVMQKVRRGQPDNPNSPPPPEEAQLGPVRDITGQDGTTPPKAAPLAAPAEGSPLEEAAAMAAASAPDSLSPVLPADIEELLASAPAVGARALAAKVLGASSRDMATLDRLLGEMDALLSASGRAAPTPRRPGAPRPAAERRPRPAPVEAAPAAPVARAAEEDRLPPPVEPPRPTPVAVAAAEDEAETSTDVGLPPSAAAPEPAAQPGEAAAAAEARASEVADAAASESVDERIDRFLEGASPGAFALDLEEMPAPPPLETAAARRTPAPGSGRRTPAPPLKRRSERAFPRPLSTPPPPERTIAMQSPIADEVPPPTAEPAPPAPPPTGRDAFEPEMGTLALSPVDLAAAVAAAAEASWDGATPSPDATEPSVQVPLGVDFGADLTPAFGDAAGATLESPPDITPPVAEVLDRDIPSAEAEAASLLGVDDPFGGRQEEDPFSMDVGPMLEDSGGGPPSERTVIGGLTYEYGGEADAAARPGVDARSLEVTATHPPLPTDEGEDVGFFEGEVGDIGDVPEVPPDAGAQAGLPILDEPLVDDFAPPGAGGALEATGEEATASAPALDDAFVFAETVVAEALPDEEPAHTPTTEAMPEILIDEGGLDGSSSESSEEVTARQSPLPPAPTDLPPDDDDQPRKGFFRKLFRNK